MRWLFLFVLLCLPAIVQADPVQTCPGIASNSVWTACTKVVCASPTSNEDMVQTQASSGKVWVKLGTVPATGTLARCAALNGNWWATRQALGIANPPVTTPVVISIPTDPCVGTRLGWTGGAGDVYRVYWRKAGVTEWGGGTQTGKTVMCFTDLAPDTTYEFAVTGVVGTTESAKSDIVSYKTAAVQTKAWTCTTPVMKQVGDVTQGTYTCTLQ